MANHQTKGAGMVRDLLSQLDPDGDMWAVDEKFLIGMLVEWHPDGDQYAEWWVVG